MGRIKYAETEFYSRPKWNGRDAASCKILRRKWINQANTKAARNHITQHGIDLRFSHNPSDNSRTFENAIDHMPSYLIACQRDKWLSFEIIRFDVRSLCERMTGRNRKIIRRPAEDFCFQPGSPKGKFAYPQIHMLRRNGLLDASGHIHFRRYRNLRMEAMKLFHYGRKEAETNRRQRRHIQMTRLRFANRRCHLADTFDRDERSFNLVEQQLRLRSRGEATRTTIKQGEVQLLFQPADQTADSRLRHPQQGRGTTHGTGQHRGAEGFQLSDKHAFQLGLGLNHSVYSSALHWAATSIETNSDDIAKG